MCPGRLFDDDLEGLPRRGAGVDRQRLCSQRFSVNVVRVKDDRIRHGLSPLGIDGQRPGRHCGGNRGPPAGKGVACLCRSRNGGYCRAVFVGLRCIDSCAETVFIRKEIAVAGIKDLYDRRTVGLDHFLRKSHRRKAIVALCRSCCPRTSLAPQVILFIWHIRIRAFQTFEIMMDLIRRAGACRICDSHCNRCCRHCTGHNRFVCRIAGN